MGPAGMSPRARSSSMPSMDVHRSLEDAPSLVPGQDRQKWRRDVFSWMELIAKRAEVLDKKSIATQATFAYVLYDAVHPSYQKVLDHAKDSGALNFDGQSSHQRAVVEQIIQLIGQDTPLEIIDRLLSAYQHVHTCVRHDKEQPSKYATRFRGLASEYMSLAGVSATEQESQLMAMVMLQNARLPQDTQNAVKLQLVTQSQQKSQQSAIKPISVPKEVLEELSRKIKAVIDDLKLADTLTVEGGNEDEVVEVRSISLADYENIQDSLATVLEVPDSQLAKSHQSSSASRETTSKIYLDDVYNVLQSLDSSPDPQSAAAVKQTAPFKPEDFKKAVEKATLLAWKTWQPPTRDSPNFTRTMAERKKKSRCHRCKKRGHWKNDDECPAKRQKTADVNGKGTGTIPDANPNSEKQASFFRN